MRTRDFRGVKVLLPSEDEDVITAWPPGGESEGRRIANKEFRTVDLSSQRWSGVSVSRCHFADSRLMGIVLDEVTLSDVLFEGCQFDYASLSRVKATGSVVFTRCRFREAVFSDGDISGAVFDDCDLGGAEFGSVRMHRTDLRRCELSGVSGLASLRGARVAESQLPELFAAFVAEFQIDVLEDGD